MMSAPLHYLWRGDVVSLDGMAARGHAIQTYHITTSDIHEQ